MYINGATAGALYAMACEVPCKSRLVHYLVNVTNHASTLLAQFSDKSYRLG